MGWPSMGGIRQSVTSRMAGYIRMRFKILIKDATLVTLHRS